MDMEDGPTRTHTLYPKVPPLKYSYAFGAGMLTLMPLVEVKPSDDAIDR